MPERERLLSDYQRLRLALRELASELMEQLSKSTLVASARKLGLSISTGGQQQPLLVFRDEYEMFVLMDYCIYHSRRGGRTVIERTLAKSPPPPGSDDLMLLEAMREVRYSLFMVESVVPGVGVNVRDLLRDVTDLLVDIGFSRTGSPGLVLAGNIVSPAELTMTIGAMLPVDELILEDALERLQRKFSATTIAQLRQLPPSEQSKLATLVIRSCLAGGASANVTAEDVQLEHAHPARVDGSIRWMERPPPPTTGSTR